jgi:uncharacterized protein (DUF433 family)
VLFRSDTFACVLAAFYFHESAVLTKDARKQVVAELAMRMKQSMTQRGGEPIDVADIDWTVSVDAVTQVNVKSLAVAVVERTTALSIAEAMVISDEEIMGGEPVFRGTRVPVRTIAAWVEFESKEKIQKSFPTLTAAMIDVAALWAMTHPQLEPPKSFGERNPHWKLVSSKWIDLSSLGSLSSR